ELQPELLPAELRADLDAEQLPLLERNVELEPLDRGGMRAQCAQADVHPFVLRIPSCLVREATLLERRANLRIDRGQSVADERLRHAPAAVVSGLQSTDVHAAIDSDQERVVPPTHADRARTT